MRLIGNFHLLKEIHCRFFGLFLGRLAHPNWGQCAVFQNGQMRKQVEMLKAHPDLGTDFVNVLEVI